MDEGRGTVIRLTKLTETSLIVHWMTAEDGLIKTVAKGARRQKSQWSGRLDLFIDGEFQWTRSRSDGLHYLGELTVRDYRRELRKTYRNAVVAAYFGQLLEMVLERDHAEPKLYDLLQRGLDWLIKKDADRRGVFHFENEVARILGLSKGLQGGLAQAYGKLPKSREHCLDLLS